ncbi:AAA family ATPase [Salinispora tropica]|uniref:SF4 helicase domain-containing protein n=1 Tax=Salinispora tropica (strain ATCC BAA-916 / DSM 44818 / JCM 13857 / NBRC 105044 / CNB-440) TaxID=369723 RepID=A4X2A5_SALTO|nr:AAA family ATPase [Salinispora tropica]ABP53005.1 hypothetical protein Strop_0521 [Salinispora tropica CNB-440]
MLNARRALTLNHDAGKELPRIPALDDLYGIGCRFRQGQVIMIAGRSGTLKSMFATWLAAKWAVPALYFSADMSAYTASSRVAALVTGDLQEEIEEGMARGGGNRQRYLDALASLPLTFAFGTPITWRHIDEEIEAHVELHDSYPSIVVFDNLMDFEAAESDYTEQMAVMAGVTAFSRETGCTSIVLHHASDKSWDAKTAPYDPPSRQEVKGGLSEKPELSLTVALDPSTMEYKVAVVKQRMGPSDPTARRFARLTAEPERTRFHPYRWRG